MEQIFIQLAIILFVAFVVSYIVRAFKQPVIIGYIIAGVIIAFILKIGYIEIGASEDPLGTWAKEQKNVLFLESTVEELRFVAQIFQVKHFQAMIRKQERLKGKPVADPFVIARAKISGACVVTQEKMTENAAKIPNVCDHFGIRWINLEGFMKEANWTF